MSNILIIKHGSLGDIVQISGVLRDIRNNHPNEKIFLLTTRPYIELLSRCPFIDGVIVDQRLPRWNFYYLLKLRKMIKKFSFSKVYDLQNSSRTSFYRKFIFNVNDWCSAKTSLKDEIRKKDFKEYSVLERFKFQLEKSKVKTSYTMNPDFSWACLNIDQLVNKFFASKFILIFPFSSPKLSHKQWPYYNELIKVIKSKYSNVEIVIAPGPQELEAAKNYEATVITNNNKALNIMELAGLIKKSSYVISNDTGPAHMAAHLGSKGLVLFGYHTTAKKVSIETKKFKSYSVNDLKDLSVNNVYLLIKKELDLIN